MQRLRNLATYDWLILTSVNGVEALFERMAKKEARMPSALAHLKIAAIGPATRKAIEAARPAGDGHAEGIHRRVGGGVAAAASEREAGAAGARQSRPRRDSARAAAGGSEVDVVEAYETVAPKSSEKRLRAALASQTRKPHAITFTSSSTVKNFVALLGLRGARAALKKSAPHRGVHSASIGPVTSATLREFGLPVDIEAKEYTIPGLVAAIVKRLGS